MAGGSAVHVDDVELVDAGFSLGFQHFEPDFLAAVFLGEADDLAVAHGLVAHVDGLPASVAEERDAVFLNAVDAAVGESVGRGLRVAIFEDGDFVEGGFGVERHGELCLRLSGHPVGLHAAVHGHFRTVASVLGVFPRGGLGRCCQRDELAVARQGPVAAQAEAPAQGDGGVGIVFADAAVGGGRYVHDERVAVVRAPVEEFFQFIQVACRLRFLFVEPRPVFADADGVLEGQVIGLAFVEILLFVGFVGDFRVPQAEVAGEILEGVFVVDGHGVGQGEAAAAFLQHDGVVDSDGAVGLVLLDEAVDAGQVPLVDGAVPPAVKPEFAHGAVLGEQFGELVAHVVDILFRVLVAVAGLMAVPQGIVDGKLEAVFLAGFGYGAHYVGLDGRGGYVVVGILAVPEAETVVMLGDEQHIAETGVAGHAYPLVAVEPGGVVLFNGDGAVGPFGFTVGIDAEVDKHAVAALLHGLLGGVGLLRGNDFLCPGGQQVAGQEQEKQNLFHSVSFLMVV